MRGWSVLRKLRQDSLLLLPAQAQRNRERKESAGGLEPPVLLLSIKCQVDLRAVAVVACESGLRGQGVESRCQRVVCKNNDPGKICERNPRIGNEHRFYAITTFR